MAKSRIEWTDETWNPVTGCTKVSDGCRHCYAERMAHRFGWDFGRVTVHEDRIGLPLRWRRPRRCFVCSMGDLFHPDVAPSTVARILDVMCCDRAERHTFQILTKRPFFWRKFVFWLSENWPSHSPICRALFTIADESGVVTHEPKFPSNIWMGISAENQAAYDARIDATHEFPTWVTFLSLEPLLGPINLNIDAHPIGWVIVGGESGGNARPMDPRWAADIREECADHGVPFFMKQLSQADAPRSFKDFHAFPRNLQVREFPE